jgi:hypothetical protein
MNLNRFLTVTVLILSMLGLSACARLEVGVETTPSPDNAVVDTAVASTLRAPQPTLTSIPTATPEPATEVSITPESSPTPAVTAPATLFPTPASPFAGLVYRQGDQLYRIDPSGQPAALAPGLDPQILPGQYTSRAVFSPDGKTMISWWDFSDLWLVDLATGKAKNLTSTPDRVEYSAQFWPARPDVIIFLSQAVADQGPGGGYLSAIQVDGSDYRLLDEISASIGLPALSPDGQVIASDRGGEAWLYRWDSGPEQLNLVDYNVDRPLKMANPAWSPKGKYLAWMAAPDPTNPDSQAGLALFNVEAHSYRLLHPFQSPGHGGWYITPVWSPDGAWLAIFDESVTQPGIWVTHPDGSGESLVFAASSTRSVSGLQVWWSPDSKQLLVFDPNAEGGVRVELIDIVTGEKIPLPIPAGSIPLAWTH